MSALHSSQFLKGFNKVCTFGLVSTELHFEELQLQDADTKA